MKRFPAPLILFALTAAVCAWAQDAAPAVKAAAPRAGTSIFANEATLLDIFLRGGVMMWPILLALIIGLACSIERLINLRGEKHAPKDFHKDIVHLVDTRGVDAGLGRCLDKQSSLSRVLYAALLRYGTSRQDMETAVKDEGARVLYDLRRNLRLVSTLSILAPLLGFLGTCVGLISSFDQAGGAEKPGAIASGVAEALLATAFGLSAAILLAFFYFHLKAKSGDIVRDIEERGIDAVITLDRKARQSIRLIDDIEEQIVTKDMPAVKPLPIDFEKELEPSREGSGVKSSITTHVGMSAAQPPLPEKTDKKASSGVRDV